MSDAAKSNLPENNVIYFNAMGGSSYDTATYYTPKEVAEILYGLGYDPKAPLRLIELAGGTGIVAEEVKKIFANTHAVNVDLAKGMTQQDADNHRSDAIHHADITKPLGDEILDGKFDVAAIVSSLEFIKPEDLPKVAQNLKDALKPGGHAYITIRESTTRQGDKQDEVSQDMTFHEPNNVIKLFPGFKDVANFKSGAYPFTSKVNPDEEKEVEFTTLILRAPEHSSGMA